MAAQLDSSPSSQSNSTCIQDHWTENEKVVGVRVRDVIDLYVLSQTHFKLFNGSNGQPAITDEQLRAFVIPPWPFEHTQVQLYRLLTRRETNQTQFKDLLRMHREAAEKMIEETSK